jgi:hypothetical protein
VGVAGRRPPRSNVIDLRWKVEGMKESNVDLANQQFRIDVVVLRPA